MSEPVRYSLEFDIEKFTKETNNIEVIISPFLDFGTNIVLKFTQAAPTKFAYKNNDKSLEAILEEDQTTDNVISVVQIPFVISDKNEVAYIKDCVQHNKFTKLFVHLINNYLDEDFEFSYGQLYNVEFVYLTPDNSIREILSTKQFIFYNRYSNQLFPKNIARLSHSKETRRMFYKQFGAAFERVSFIKHDRETKFWTDYNCKKTLEMMKCALSKYSFNQKRCDGCTTINNYINYYNLNDSCTAEQIKDTLFAKSHALSKAFSDDIANNWGVHFYYCSIQDRKQFSKLQNWVKKQWKSNKRLVVTTVVENTFIVCYKETDIE